MEIYRIDGSGSDRHDQKLNGSEPAKAMDR